MYLHNVLVFMFLYVLCLVRVLSVALLWPRAAVGFPWTGSLDLCMPGTVFRGVHFWNMDLCISGTLDLWNTGFVHFWKTGFVHPWNTGFVHLWKTGFVHLWNTGFVHLWNTGLVNLWNTGFVHLWNTCLELIISGIL